MKRKRLNKLDWFARTISRGEFEGKKLYFESWKEMLSYMSSANMIWGDSNIWLAQLEEFLEKKEE